MSNITIPSDVEFLSYVPEIKPAKQEYIIIIPIILSSTKSTSTQTVELLAPNDNIKANIFYTNTSDDQKELYYLFQSFSSDNIIILPIKSNYIFDGVDFIIEGDPITWSFNPNDNANVMKLDKNESTYIAHYYFCCFNDFDYLDYFTPTSIYLDINNLPQPEIDSPEIIPVANNTIIFAQDTNQFYIYNDNSWEIFSNTLPNITEEEIDLFIRGLVYGEDVEPHDDDSDDDETGDETGDGGVTK